MSTSATTVQLEIMARGETPQTISIDKYISLSMQYYMQNQCNCGNVSTVKCTIVMEIHRNIRQLVTKVVSRQTWINNNENDNARYSMTNVYFVVMSSSVNIARTQTHSKITHFESVLNSCLNYTLMHVKLIKGVTIQC